MRNASITGTDGRRMRESMAQVVEEYDDHWLWWLRNARQKWTLSDYVFFVMDIRATAYASTRG